MITITDQAYAKIHEIQQQEHTQDPLRVFVQGGGCSGFQYGFTFDNNPSDPADFCMTNDHGVRVLIDAMSMNLMTGAEIDYEEDLFGEQFVIRNPNMTSQCGCGNSFSV